MYLWHDRERNSGGWGGYSRAMTRAIRTTRKTTSTGKMCRKHSMQMLVGCFQGNIKSAGGLTKGCSVHSSFRKTRTWADPFSVQWPHPELLQLLGVFGATYIHQADQSRDENLALQVCLFLNHAQSTASLKTLHQVLKFISNIDSLPSPT
jgi:hypothetical protein